MTIVAKFTLANADIGDKQLHPRFPVFADPDASIKLVRAKSNFEDFESQVTALTDRSSKIRIQIKQCHHYASSLNEYTNTAYRRGILNERTALIKDEILLLTKEVVSLCQRVEKEYRKNSPIATRIAALYNHFQKGYTEFQSLWQDLTKLGQRAEAHQICTAVRRATSPVRPDRQAQTRRARSTSSDWSLRAHKGDEARSEDEPERGRSKLRQGGSAPNNEMASLYKGRNEAEIRERIRLEMAEEYHLEPWLRFKEHSTNDHLQYIEEACKANRSPIPPSIETPASMYWVYHIQLREEVDKRN